MKNKNELAKDWAKYKSIEYYNNSISIEQECKESFIAGYDKAMEWIEFGTQKYPSENLLALKFDDGTVCLSTDETLPFAVMTHFKIIE